MVPPLARALQIELLIWRILVRARTSLPTQTEEGNSRIRWILVEAAQHASRHDARLSQFYLRVMKRRGHNRAIVAVARKLLVTIYRVLNHHREFRGLRPELYTNKIGRLERITRSSLQTV
jgi:hypothetical protein